MQLFKWSSPCTNYHKLFVFVVGFLWMLAVCVELNDVTHHIKYPITDLHFISMVISEIHLHVT
jgi:hypothetical protein